MNYDEALEYIHSVSWVNKKPGLNRIRDLLNKLENPEKDLKFVHVAGTNGKGSTSAMLASVLKEAGYRVGLFTSPFIYIFNERIQYNGEMISNEELAEIVTFIRPLAETMEEAPTEFDLNTAIGMEFFRRKKCDIVVLEVGLGGTFDSTNVIEDSLVSVITAIGFDHMRILGNTITEIASSKAGIIKQNGDVVVYGKNAEALEVFEKVCKEKNARMICPDYQTLRREKVDLHGQVFDYKDWKELKVSLIGGYQLFNAAVVLEIIQVLRKKGYKISDEALREGLRTAKWIGRFELLHENPVFIVDGAHNPQGIKATAESLKLLFEDKKILFIVGAMKDKDVANMMRELVPSASEFFTVTPPTPRAMEAKELQAVLEGMGVKVTAYDNIEKACKEAIEKAGFDGIICALGSLYMIGDIKRSILNWE